MLVPPRSSCASGGSQTVLSIFPANGLSSSPSRTFTKVSRAGLAARTSTSPSWSLTNLCRFRCVNDEVELLPLLSLRGADRACFRTRPGSVDQGCTKSTHLAKEDKPKAASKPTAPAPSAAAPSSVSKSGVETYGAPAPALPAGSTTLAAANTAVAASASAAPPTPAFVEEVDDEAAPLPSGGACKRTSCKYRLDAAEPAARDQQPDCLYHPGAPIFREGSKGYTCCKRRVLDFDDFLKMEGCRTADSGHLFVGQKKEVRRRIRTRWMALPPANPHYPFSRCHSRRPRRSSPLVSTTIRRRP